MLVEKENSTPLMEEDKLPNLTGKIKTDENGREYIDNPNSPNGREYVYSSGVTNWDIYRKAAQENQTPQSWLQGSPIQYNVADGYDTNMSYESLINPELREDYFAKQQSLLGLIGKGAVRGVSAITAGTLESLGYLVNPNTYRALFGEEIVGDFENQFSKTFRELKESMNDLTDPIYRTMQSKSDSLWDAMFDATFWAGNAESIATTLSLMIPGIAAAKGFSTIGKGLGKLGMKLGATAKGAANTARITANVGAGLTSRIMESGMEAKEAYDSFIEAHKLDDKYVNDEAQLRLDAGKAASITMQANMPLFLLDAFQFDSILSGFASFKNANSRLKRIANSLSDYGMNAVSEGLEEGTQYVIQKEAEFSALSDPELKKMLGESFSERWDKYTDDIEFKTSILLGAAGGGLFRAAGPTLNKIYTKALDRLNKYRTAKEIATVQKNPDAFKILSQHEFEEQLGKHVKADSLDQLIQMYENRVGTLEGEDQVTANNYLETLKAIKPTIDSLQKYPAFRKNKKATTLYALVEQEGIKQQALDQTLNNELNTAVQSIIEGKEDASSIVLALRNRAAQEVLKNIDTISRVKDLGESNFKNHYKKHITDNKQLILQKNNLSNIIARNPKLEDIAYNLEKNFAERMISIDLLTEMQNLKTEPEETTKEKTSPKSKEKVSEQTTKTNEEKTEEKVNKKKSKSSESPEQDSDSKISNDEGLDYSSTESGNISETDEFDIDDSITATMNEELFGPVQQDSNDSITDKSRNKDEVVNDIVESINSASSLNEYLAARDEAKKSAETNTLSKEAFNKIYQSEDDLLRDFSLDNPTESQANALAARFFDITEEPVAAELIKEALMNKTPINEQLLGEEEFIAYNEVLDYIKGLQESKQYGNVTPSQDIPDNIPVQEDNSQQSDNVETEYNQNDPLRLVSFKYSYDKYTDSQGNQRIKTIPQNRMDSIKYNSYISFDETIKPEVANVGSKIFFGIPEEFLQYQHSADDADILIYDENNNGISWLRREKKAREWKATDQEIHILKQQRALLYNKAVSYQGEPVLINGKKVIPCNVSSFITSKSYGIITHDGDNYYPIKEALQVDNVEDIKLGIVVGKETNGYTFNIPGVDMNNFHTPPADNFRTGHLFAMVQSANGDYFPLRLYTQKYNTLQQGSALHNYYRTNINNAFKKILDSDPEVSSKGSYELSKYVVIRLVKNNSADLPFMVQKYNGSEYEDVEAVSREEAINRVKESLINIPYNLLNKSGNKIMNELLNSDALQMNIFPGEPFHSPTFGYDRNLVDLNPVKETISEVKEPTKETKIEESKPKEKITDPVEQSFEQTLTVDAIKELPNSPKKRGPLSGPNNKLANKLKGKNFIKPDLSRKAEWGKDDDKYRLMSEPLNYEKADLNKELSWLKENLPQLTDNELVEIHRGLINVGNLYAWGRFKDGIIELSDIAASGTTYHEAFHAVFNMFLTESETNKLLEKARKELGLTGKSDVAVEETLADKFRDYVETDQITNKSILDKISDFFKNIYYLIRNKLHLNPSIEQVFYDINRGRYSKKKFEKNRPLVERNWLSNITPSVYKRRVDMLVDTFEDIIDNLAQESPELSRVDVIKQYSLEDYILTIHDQLYASAHGDNAIYTDPTQIDAIDLITDELVQFDADGNPQFGQLALDMLKEISALEGITFKAQQIVDMDMNQQDENTEFMNNEEVVKQEGWQIDQMLISPVTKLRQSTRNIIRRIPKMTSDGTLVSPDDLGYQPYMSGTEVFATMLNKLSTMNKPSDLMKTLESLSQSFPWVDSIIDILKSDPKLQVDFYNSFRNDSVEYMIISSQSDGTMRVFGGNSVNKAGELLRIWSSNYSLASHNKEELVKSLKENSDKIYKIYQEVSSNPFRLHKVRLWKKNWKSGKFSNPQINAWAREVSSMLNTIGIDSKPSELVKVFQSNMKLNDEKSNFQPMQDFLLNSFRVLRAFHDTINKDDYDIKRNTYYDLELLPVNVRIKALSSALSNVRPSLYESSLREDGKTYSTNITPSFIGKLFKRLTDVTDKSAFEPFKKSFFYTDNEGKFTHPWLKELYNIKVKDLASEIQVSMFLEKDKTRYSELSKPDFLGSKINLWYNNGARDYGYFMLPIPSDASSMPVIRFPKSYDLSSSLDGLVELAKAEIRRIEVVKERSKKIKNGEIYEIKNFDKRGSKFLMFPFLNKYNIDELKTSEATLRKYIEEAMEEGFEKFKSNPDLDGTKYDKRITESKLKEFYYNDTLAQYSIMTMTSGDLAYYKNDVDFFKRNKQNMSPGQYGDWETLGIPEKFKAIRMKDNEIPSLVADAYYENLKLNGVSTTEAMIIASKFGYSNYTDSEGNKKVKLPNGQIIDSGLNNATDGQTFITLDRYRDIARMNSKWDDAKESSYQRLKNGTYNVEDILTFSLQPIKPYMFAPHITDSGVDINGKNTSLYQPLQNKNSEAVLIPQMVQNNSLLSALVKGMEDNGIDAVYFESAVKEGIELNTSQELKDKLRKQGKPILPDTLLHFNGDPRELSEANVKYYYLSNDDYMYQMDTPEHFRNTLQLFGSQIRKHIIANLDEDAEFYIEDMKFTGKNIASLFDDILAWNYDKNYKKVIDKIGTIDGLAKELQGGIMQRKFAENTTEAVQLMNYKGEKVFKLPLYFPLQSNRIFQMISSIFRNNIIRNKVSGGALYQASSYGFDNSLKVHMKDGHIEYVDCIMPYTYSNQLAQLADENGMIDPSKVEDKELLKVICYRIPTEDKYSAVPLRIKGFSSPAEGGIIKLPSDILTITGSDLDIDKMYFLSYAAKYTPAKYNLSKIRTWMVNNGLLSDIFSSGNYQEEMNYLSDLLEKYDSGEKLSTEESEAMNEVSKFLKEHPDLVFQKSKLEKIKYNYKQSPEKQSVEASNNALIDIMYSILTSKDAFKTMVSGANTSMFADVIGTLEKIEKKKSEGDRLFDPSFLTDTYYEYMAGKALTGVFAANSANHSMLQFYNVNLNKKNAITLDGKTVTRISPVKTLDGTNNVTNILGSFLATVVDNAKTLTASKVNLNMFTASTYTLLLRMGFDPKTVMYFMSQPSLRLLSDKVMAKGDMFNYRDSIEEVIKVFSKHTNEQSRLDLKKNGFTQFKQSDLIKAIENFNKNGGDIDLFENAKQILILEAFRDLIEPANTLRSINSAMRTETYGAAPNPGDTIANLAKAKKLGRKSIVSGLGDILTYVSRGEEYEKLMHDPNVKKSLISANTNGVVEYDNFISKYTPFNTNIFTDYRSLLSEAIHDNLTGSEIDELNTIMLNHLTESLDFFKFTKEQKNAWIYKFPKKFLEIVNGDNYLKNINEFTRRLTVQNEWQSTLGGRQSIPIIKFSGSRFDNEVAKDEAIRAFEYLWRTPKYTKLAEDLLKYNFVISGWGITPNSFNHIVPISMINNIPGFNELFRETIFSDNIRVNIDNLIDSYIVNNFRNNRIVPEISKGDNYKFTDKDHSGLSLSHSSSINIKEGSYIKIPYRYIKFNNNGKIELYKLIGATKETAEYQRVGGYGTSTIFEFIEGESSFTSNNLSEKLMKSSELNAGLKRHETQAEIDLLKAMMEGETDTQNNEELDNELSDKLASVSKEAEQIKNHCKGK
jgi:hypothetical protein